MTDFLDVQSLNKAHHYLVLIYDSASQENHRHEKTK